MNNNVLDLLAKGFINRELTLKPEDLSKAVIMVVNHHVRLSTDGVDELRNAYGSVDKNSAVETYSKKLFDGVIDGNSKDSDLFWNLFNSMTTGLMVESIKESLIESIKEVEE